MTKISDTSPLFRPSFLEQHAPEFVEASEAAGEARAAADAKQAALQDLERRKAKLEADADRTALDALKGRGDEATPRRLAAEADALAEQIGAAREAANQAERHAAQTAQAKEAAAEGARSRIADSLTARHRILLAEMARHALALDALFAEADELNREQIRLGVSPGGLPGIAFTWVEFARGHSQRFRGEQLVEWARNAGLDLDGPAAAKRKAA